MTSLNQSNNARSNRGATNIAAALNNAKPGVPRPIDSDPLSLLMRGVRGLRFSRDENDVALAIRDLERAGELGDAEAYFLLGSLNLHCAANLIPRNVSKARRYFELAANMGLKKARKELKKLD